MSKVVMGIQIKVGSKELLQKMEEDKSSIFVAESFLNMQGELRTRGTPSVFLRLASCTLSCTFCDTTEVWMQGTPYSVEQLFSMFTEKGWIAKFQIGQAHFVITGGSPLRQSDRLLPFLRALKAASALPYIEVETECVLLPEMQFDQYVKQYNVSPKLSNSKMSVERRIVPEVLAFHMNDPRSFFKFVVRTDEDFKELEETYIKPFGLHSSLYKVTLMPEASTRQELSERAQKVAEYALSKGYCWTSREQIVIYDRTTGV